MPVQFHPIQLTIMDSRNTTNETRRKYYLANAERIKAKAKKHYHEHSKHWSDERKAIIRDRVREWRKNNRERYREYARKYYHENREAFVGYTHTRRARKLASGGTWTARDIREQFTKQNGRCFYCCKELLGVNFHTDHIIALSRGGMTNRSNLAIACEFCNVSKGVKSALDHVLRLVN